MKKLKPLVNDILDFEDTNCESIQWNWMHIIISLNSYYIVSYSGGRLTIEILAALPYVLRDNKVKPTRERLITLTPVS